MSWQSWMKRSRSWMQRRRGGWMQKRCNHWEPLCCQSRSLHTANEASVSSKKSGLTLNWTAFLSLFKNLLVVVYMFVCKMSLSSVM